MGTTPEQRVSPVEKYAPGQAWLNAGSLNFALFPAVNIPKYGAEFLGLIQGASLKSILEYVPRGATKKKAKKASHMGWLNFNCVPDSALWNYGYVNIGCMGLIALNGKGRRLTTLYRLEHILISTGDRDTDLLTSFEQN